MATRSEIIAELTAPGQPFELVEEPCPGGPPLRLYKNAPAAMRSIIEGTKVHGDKIFLIYEDETYTFNEVYDRVASLAAHWREKGVKKGDRIAIGMRNYPEWVIGFWACQTLGCIAVALNAWWTGAELAFAIEDSSPSAMIIDGERLERMADLIKGLDLKALVVARASKADENFESIVANKVPGLPDETIEPNDPATILYTSGTTGKPKGAVATQRNHMTNLWNTNLAGALARRIAEEAGTVFPENPPQPGTLQTFPYFHIGGLTGLYVSTFVGSKVALMYKWHPMEGVRLVEKYKLSSTSGVPMVVRQLLETGAEAGADLSSLAGISSGGASVPPDLIRRIGKQFEEKVSPGNGYGLTETTSAVITNGGADYLSHPDSVGRPVPTCDARIVDDNGNDVAQGQIGEVWLRGPNIVLGYWQNPEATEASFRDRWFRSGDLGFVDAEGFYHIVDRKKDVVIRGGENVYCAEVEAAILEYPGVKDVAVIGLPHDVLGEEVAAIVQIKDSIRSDSLEDDIKQFLSDHLAKFKIPSVFRFDSEDLPRTATGKILKRDLKAGFVRAA